jgi:PAS domain S-box-containing protein
MNPRKKQNLDLISSKKVKKKKERGTLLNSYEKIDRLFAWTINFENEFTFISPRVKEILGYEPKEMLFRTPANFIPGEESEQFSQKISFFKENLTSFWSLRCNFIKKNGEKILLEINGVAVYDKNRVLCGYEGITYEV